MQGNEEGEVREGERWRKSKNKKKNRGMIKEGDKRREKMEEKRKKGEEKNWGKEV